MGFGGFLKGIGKGIGRAVSRPVRGIGRAVRGDFKGALGDIGHGLKRGAQFAALVGSGGIAAPLLAAGGGMLERGTEQGAGIGNVLGAGLKGASGAVAARGVGNIGRSLLGTGTQAAGQAAGQAVAPAAYNPAGPVMSFASPVAETGGRLSGIGNALKSGSEFLEAHPKSVEFAGNLLSGRAEAQQFESQEKRYREELAFRREQEEYDKSEKAMLRQMILSGVWRG